MEEKNNGKQEFQRNIAMTYAMKNECLEIQYETMKVLQKKFRELEELSKNQMGKALLETINTMAEIGKAILQD